MFGRKSQNSPSSQKKRRFARLFTGLVIFTLLWALIATLLPGIPGPRDAAKAAMRWIKHRSDDVYHYANKSELEESAERVRAMAEEQRPEPGEVADSIRAGKSGKPASGALADSIMQEELKGLSTKPPVGGKVINILVAGLDSRIGAKGARSDAIHLFTVNPDSAIVDITSIPRGTYVDLGHHDSTGLNIITYSRMRGTERLLRAVEEVTGKRPVKYYVEAGFSQVMGILELLKYEDPVGTLQFLRARKSFYTGDVQRSHNQGVFLRQALIDKFSMLTGATGDVIITTGLKFVSTNLTKDICKGLVYALEQRGFPNHRADAVRVKMLSKYKFRLQSILPEPETIRTVEKWAEQHGEENRNHERYVVSRLRNINRLATKDSAAPVRIVNRLDRIAEQHAWLQIQNKQARYGIRDTIIGLLDYAYTKMGKREDAERIRDLKRAEDMLWDATGAKK